MACLVIPHVELEIALDPVDRNVPVSNSYYGSRMNMVAYDALALASALASASALVVASFVALASVVASALALVVASFVALVVVPVPVLALVSFVALAGS